jgi:two-component system sensor histidine kinase UhpB
VALIAGLLVQRARRRHAEREALENAERNRDLAARLIESQEAERARIARDLHDDACQELAAAAMGLEQVLHDGSRLGASDVRSLLTTVHAKTAGTAETLRRLSHDLHPGVLQHVGLRAALEGHCLEIERLHRMRIRFVAQDADVPGTDDTAVALFRVAQEALRNAAQHGRASHAELALTRHDDTLVLRITDDGAGFALPSDRRARGLGLVSMEERVRLLGGAIHVESSPGHGTSVEARVPWRDSAATALA